MVWCGVGRNIVYTEGEKIIVEYNGGGIIYVVYDSGEKRMRWKVDCGTVIKKERKKKKYDE